MEWTEVRMNADACATFLTPLRIEKISARTWLLIDDLLYRTELLNGVLVVPRGFQTNFASVPRWAFSIFPPVDLYDSASTLHDAGYAHALSTPDHQRIHLVKAWTDRLFYEAMRASGVNQIRATLMYQAVVWWGRPATHPLAAHAP
jgi:hypothetical protein